MWSWVSWAPISRSQHRGTSRIDVHSVSALCTWASWARLSMHVAQSIGCLWGLSLLIATAFIAFLLQLTLSAPWLRIWPEILQNQWKNAIFALGFGPILEPLLGSAEAPEMDPKMGSKRRSKQLKICNFIEKISVFWKMLDVESNVLLILAYFFDGLAVSVCYWIFVKMHETRLRSFLLENFKFFLNNCFLVNGQIV